jgi:hypothetical protein
MRTYGRTQHRKLLNRPRKAGKAVLPDFARSPGNAQTSEFVVFAMPPRRLGGLVVQIDGLMMAMSAATAMKAAAAVSTPAAVATNREAGIG